MQIIIANSNPVHQPIEAEALNELNALIIHNNDELSFEKLQLIKPEYIFFLHWSFIIPEKIYTNFNCVVFHMTDLPFGRGGSPLQNLIIRGFKKTKISALKVTKGIDEGPIYLKKDLDLSGSAQEIFERAGNVMFVMIKEIMNNNLIPVQQQGDISVFQRRRPEESNLQTISKENSLEKIYDLIRMLDAPGYPKAFIDIDNFRIEFSRASLKADESIIADVRITKK